MWVTHPDTPETNTIMGNTFFSLPTPFFNSCNLDWNNFTSSSLPCNFILVSRSWASEDDLIFFMFHFLLLAAAYVTRSDNSPADNCTDEVAARTASLLDDSSCMIAVSCVFWLYYIWFLFVRSRGFCISTKIDANICARARWCCRLREFIVWVRNEIIWIVRLYLCCIIIAVTSYYVSCLIGQWVDNYAARAFVIIFLVHYNYYCCIQLRCRRTMPSLLYGLLR